jgi:hypothetical protein
MSWFSDFTQNFASNLKRIGHNVNRTFNVIKTHARRALPIVRKISERVREGARQYTHLPVVGNYMSSVSQAADAINRGSHIAERFFDHADRFQRDLGVDS